MSMERIIIMTMSIAMTVKRDILMGIAMTA